MTLKAIIAIVACSALAACSTGQRQERAYRSHMRQLVERLPSIGDPGKVAATDIAFARAARDDGQWTAFAEYAADGAMLHGRNGAIPAAPWLAQQANPPVAVRWGPKAVWSSCDGTLAVSFGRFVDPDGLAGSYVTVWQWQPEDRTYRWIYDLGAPDNPKRPPETDPADDDPDAIVVQGLALVEGKTADCPEGSSLQGTAQTADRYTSADGTLSWSFEHNGPADRRVTVDWIRDGQRQRALDFTAPAPLES